MRLKTLLFTLALGAMTFASCEKPAEPVDPTPTPDPEPEVVEPKLVKPEVKAEDKTLTISGTVSDFKFIDKEKTPVGVWTSLDKGKKKAESAGGFDAAKNLISGTVTGLEYAKAYTAGTFVSVEGKKYYSEGVEITLTEPTPDPEPQPEVTPVVFSELHATIDGKNVTFTAKTADFTYVDAENTAVGIWYTTEGSTEKKKIAGKYDAQTGIISGKAENLAYGIYSFGAYANEDNTEQYSEGKEVRLVEPPVFSEVAAKAETMKISASGKVTGFTFKDMETTAVGLWYKTETTERKEAKGEYAEQTGTITAVTKVLPAGTYTVGVWVRKDQVKFYSEGVVVTLESNPGFHLPGYDNGIQF